MNIGIFDSGLGGLLITHSLIQQLPDYDYIYLGDTARVPYGNRSQAAIYEFTRQSIDYLCAQGCNLIIVACNTASAEALRRIQQEHLPAHQPQCRVLGVLIPAAETAATGQRIGILATNAAIASKAFDREIIKLNPTAQITPVAAPLLVPLIENNGLEWVGPILEHYLQPFQAAHIDTLILGCTHYPYLKDRIRAQLGAAVTVVCQDEIIPPALHAYLQRHPEIATKLSRHSRRRFLVTDLAPSTQILANALFHEPIKLELIPQLADTTKS